MIWAWHERALDAVFKRESHGNAELGLDGFS
jgi:hypothetical protein